MYTGVQKYYKGDGMILEENDKYIKITLNEKDRKRGIVNLLEENIPSFGVLKSSDDLEWYVAINFRNRLNDIIYKLNGASQLSIFSY